MCIIYIYIYIRHNYYSKLNLFYFIFFFFHSFFLCFVFHFLFHKGTKIFSEETRRKQDMDKDWSRIRGIWKIGQDWDSNTLSLVSLCTLITILWSLLLSATQHTEVLRNLHPILELFPLTRSYPRYLISGSLKNRLGDQTRPGDFSSEGASPLPPPGPGCGDWSEPTDEAVEEDEGDTPEVVVRIIPGPGGPPGPPLI